MRRAVIDQPGVRIFVIGLALSLFLGLALRVQISDARIQIFLNKSIDRLQKDFFVDYEVAKVNLSRWGLPLPALVIQNIRLSPMSTVCQSSQIFIDELEVPISISALLGLSKIIPKIRIKEIELRLSDIEKCIGENKTESKSSGNSLTGAKSDEPNVKNIFSNNTKAELKEIYIEKLKIISRTKADQPILLKQLNFDLFYFQNKLSEVHIKSKINALKDPKSEVYFLNSDLTAVFKAKENNEVESIVSVNGKLLDGDVKFFTQATSESKKITYDLVLERVSVKAFAPLVENSDLYKSINLEKTPISVSLVNNGEILLNDKISINSKFKNVLMNIESSLIRISDLEMHYGTKLTIKPFELTVESLSLSKLKNLEQFRNKLDSFDSLGVFSGLLEYKNENSFRVKGNIKNIKAVFSNRGRRDLQNIEQVDVEAIRTANELRFEASNFIVNNEKVEGKFWAQYNVNSFSSSAQLKMTGVTLNDNIWEQFTFVKQSPRIDILWNYKKFDIETHNIKIYADQISLPGVKLEELNVELFQIFSNEGAHNTLNVTIKPSRLSTDASFLANSSVNQVLNPANGFKLEKLNSSKTTMSLSGRDWKNLSFYLDSYFLSDLSPKSESHLTLKGDVKYEIGLAAKLVLQNRSSIFKFDLSRNQSDEIVIKNAP